MILGCAFPCRLLPLGWLDKPRTHTLNRSRLLLASALVAVTTLLIAGCGPATRWQGLTKIGVVAPFSGYDAETAYGMLVAIRSNVDAWNGGAAGRYGVEIVALDDGGQADSAAAKARELVRDPSVVAAIAHARGDVSFGPYERAGLPVIAIGGPMVAQPGEYVIGSCSTAQSEGKEAAEYARRSVAMNPIVVEASGEGYHSAANAFVEVLGPGVPRVTIDPASWRTSASVRANQALAVAAADFVYYSGPYDLVTHLAAGLGEDATLLAGADADTTGLDRLAPKGARQIKRIAVCGATDRIPLDSGPRRAAGLATSATETILQRINAATEPGQFSRAKLADDLSQLLAAPAGKGEDLVQRSRAVIY